MATPKAALVIDAGVVRTVTSSDGLLVGDVLDTSAASLGFRVGGGPSLLLLLPTLAKFTTGLQLPYTPVSSDYSTLASDAFVAVTPAAGRVITLLDATQVPAGTIQVIFDATGGASADPISVLGDPGLNQTIDGAASASIASNWGTLRVVSTGSNWKTW
jgi:hypothetical protein